MRGGDVKEVKKHLIITIFITVFLSIIFVQNNSVVFADWWERPSVWPTQPGIERDRIPTSPPEPTQAVPTTVPTTGPQQPTVTPTPRIGEPTGVPSEGGGEEEDLCAGNSYTGPYCGWSPEKDRPSAEGARIGGPEVLGLSYTSGDDLTVSDIMLLTGVLCLLLYVRSKTGLTIRPR